MTDEEWFKAMIPDATAAEIEAFCERVAIKVADGTRESDARRQAFDTRIPYTR